MNTRIRPIGEIDQCAREALVRELGIVDAIRFLNQFRSGRGNYTEDRSKCFEGKSVRQLGAEIMAAKRAGELNENSSS
jgi:hypothetical protein